MPSLPSRALRRSARDPFFLFFLVTVVLCLLRARDLPDRRRLRMPPSASPTWRLLGSRARSPQSAAPCGRRPLPSPWLLGGRRGVRGADRRHLARERRDGVHVGGQARGARRPRACGVVLARLGGATRGARRSSCSARDGRGCRLGGRAVRPRRGRPAAVVPRRARHGGARNDGDRRRPGRAVRAPWPGRVADASAALVAGSVAVTLGAALASLLGLYLAAGALSRSPLRPARACTAIAAARDGRGRRSRSPAGTLVAPERRARLPQVLVRRPSPTGRASTRRAGASA